MQKSKEQLLQENTELKELIGDMYEDLLGHQCENASNFFTKYLTITEGVNYADLEV